MGFDKISRNQTRMRKYIRRLGESWEKLGWVSIYFEEFRRNQARLEKMKFGIWLVYIRF